MLTKFPEVWKEVDYKEPIVDFIFGHWVQTEVQILQIGVVLQKMQVLQRLYIIVITEQKVLGKIVPFVNGQDSSICKKIGILHIWKSGRYHT